VLLKNAHAHAGTSQVGGDDGGVVTAADDYCIK
jgi:hypothetical protein